MECWNIGVLEQKERQGAAFQHSKTPLLQYSVSYLALALFVPGVRADDTNNAFAFDNLAIFAKLLYRCSDFHISNHFSAFDSTTMRPSDKS